jgi:hypothetical protein
VEVDQQHDNVVRGRFRREPVADTVVVVETCDQDGRVITREELSVVRPATAVRQHEQLVRMVTSQMPDARIVRAGEGQIKFLCRGYVIRSFYDDVSAPELV